MRVDPVELQEPALPTLPHYDGRVAPMSGVGRTTVSEIDLLGESAALTKLREQEFIARLERPEETALELHERSLQCRRRSASIPRLLEGSTFDSMRGAGKAPGEAAVRRKSSVRFDFNMNL